MAGHLARRIASLAPSSAVGLDATRTLTAYVGYLAVQRLGLPVVPLDPAWPGARRSLVADTANVDFVLGDATRAGGPSVVEIDPERLAGARDASSPGPPPRGRADDIAYVLFTSGSTGAPKGVPIRHRNVASYLRHVIGRYGLAPGDRTSQMFDLTFDLSVFDLFATWGSGATLVVPSSAERMSPVNYVSRRRITHWFSVPSVVSIALELGLLRSSTMPALRSSLFCGEPLTVKQVHAWSSAAPNSTIENLYGPTELTLSCTQFRVPERQDVVTGNGTVPIGTAYPGHDVLVVDEHAQPSEVGELCIRGPQRFDGYLDERHNDGRFVAASGDGVIVVERTDHPAPDWFYRTGDMVRTEGGALVHLGRSDSQVKVQGYRVELGEVEAALRACDGVVDAVAAAVEGVGGLTRLRAAYTGTPTPDDDVFNTLRDLLPAYMVPDELRHLERMPLNANSKVDRRRVTDLLSAPDPPA